MRRALIALAAASALLLAYFGAKWMLFDPPPPTLDYPNRLQKRSVARSGFKSAELCAGCHKAIYDDWRGSYMSRSFRAGIGAIELHAISLALRGIEPEERRWCIQCHAPLALTEPEDLAASDPLSREGVTCTVCHSVTEAHPGANPADVALEPLAGMSGPFADARSPMHPSRRGELFADSSSALCGTCHWSAYPLNGLPIDWTYPEWREYLEAAVRRGEEARSCQECHMPASEGKAAQLDGAPRRRIASHRFPGGRDETILRKSAALSWELRREAGGGGILKVMVRNLAGHNLPTGNAAWPQLELAVRFLDGARAIELASFDYHASYRLPDGAETYDTTIARTTGPNTTLRPFETRTETIRIPERLLRLRDARPQACAIELVLAHQYIRILDPAAPFLAEGNRTRTILLHVYQWMTLKEANLGNVLKVLADGDTFSRLRRTSELGTQPRVILRREIVKP